MIHYNSLMMWFAVGAGVFVSMGVRVGLTGDEVNEGNGVIGIGVGCMSDSSVGRKNCARSSLVNRCGIARSSARASI